jgi:hypothetical protein
MEMSWMETIQLLGLDVIAFILLALTLLNVVEHAVHTAWEAAGRAVQGVHSAALYRHATEPGHRPSAATQVATVSWE